MEHCFENNMLFYKKPNIVLVMAEKNVLSHILFALRLDDESIIYTTENLFNSPRVKYVEQPWTQEIIENILKKYDIETKVFVLGVSSYIAFQERLLFIEMNN